MSLLYASKELIYIYDNLNSPFLINLHSGIQICKSPSASVESGMIARTEENNIVATKHPVYFPNKVSAHVPEPNAHNGWLSVHSHTSLLKKIGFKSQVSYRSADDCDPLFHQQRTGKGEPEGQMHAEAQIS